MKDWRPTTIGELCDAGVATVQTGPFGSQLHASDYVPLGIPVVPTEAIRDRRILESDLPQIAAETANRLARHKLKAGDILFARRGVQATGHCALVLPEHEGWICGTGAILLRLQDDNPLVDAVFLSLLLASEDARDWFKHHAIGATMPNLNEGIIRRFPLLLPPLAEQRAIAAVLAALDDKIEANRRMNASLEAMARALFKSWFVDFEPVRAKAEGAAPALVPDLAALFPAAFTDSPLGPIPEGWEVKALSEIAVLRRETIDPVSLGDRTVAHLSIPAFDSGRMPVIEAASNIASNKGSVSPGSVLFSKLNPEINRVWPVVADAGVPMIASTEFLVLVPKPSTTVAWLALLLSSPGFRSIAEGMTTGTSKSHQRIQAPSFMTIDVITPRPDVTREADNLLHPLLLRAEANRALSQTLAQLRDLLLPKLLSGTLRVKDAEKIIEDAA